MATQGEDNSLLLEMGDLDSPSLSALYTAITSVRTIQWRFSDDGHYLVVTEERTIDLRAVRQIQLADEYARQAQTICAIFSEYIDYQKRQLLCDNLKNMLCTGIIAVQTDAQGLIVINILKNKQQASFLRLLIQHMTLQKQRQLQNSAGFNCLKHLLMERLRQQSNTIDVNSISVTLRRAVKGHFLSSSNC